MKYQIPHRFHSLDIIRGMAAISVVFWHWQHFFYDGSLPREFITQNQPFYSVFFLLYHKGWLAVDFFFSLSGFIFFWLYAKNINEKNISNWHFFVLIFSRLYPLHIVTFIYVLLAQILFFSEYKDYFVYPNNDFYHAILHLFLAPNWGFEKGWSFNAPVWSVSIEILVYALFFVACLNFKMNLRFSLILIVFGLLIFEIRPVLGRGIFSFFIGGLTYISYLQICQRDWVKKTLYFLLVTVIFLWISVFFETKFNWFWPVFYTTLSSQLPSEWHSFVGELTARGAVLFVTALLFPLTIMCAALIETWRGSFCEKFIFLGNISYSSYLLHFPIQLVFFVLAAKFNFGQEFFYTQKSMLIYFLILIPACLASYYLFERPVQRLLRGFLLR